MCVTAIYAARVSRRQRLARRIAPIAVLAAALLGTLLTAAPARAASSMTFQGAGYGHGIGMSQWGANGYAASGWTYQQILSHYYSGTEQSSTDSDPLRVHIVDSSSPIQVNTSGPILTWASDLSSNGYMDTLGTPMDVRIEGNGGLSIFWGGTRVFGPLAPGVSVVFTPEQSPSSLCQGVPGSGPCVLLPSTGNGYRWGQLEISRVANTSTLRAVVRDLSMDHYLYGLGEVPSSWPMAALQAQAVAGRTYALQKQRTSGNFRSVCSCTVWASTLDQAYVGFTKEADTRYAGYWRQAVDSTSRQVVTYNGSVIQALYSASSGGYTESNEIVWGTSPLPYLKAVVDDGERVAAGNPYLSWTRTYAMTDLERWLNADTRTAVGTLQSIRLIGPYGASGRSQKIRVIGSGSSKDVITDTFRSIVNRGAPNDLRSSFFNVLSGPPSVAPATQPYGAGYFLTSWTASATQTYAQTVSQACRGSIVRQYFGQAGPGELGVPWPQRDYLERQVPPGEYRMGLYQIDQQGSTSWADNVVVTPTSGSPAALPTTRCAGVDVSSSTTGDRPVLFRDGQWLFQNNYADNSYQASTAQFGSPGDIPVMGDWDGNGTKTIGVFRDGTWWLRNSNTSGPSDMLFQFGSPGDIPVVGDWYGTGKDAIGVFRNGGWWLRATASGGPTQELAWFGSPGDTPVTGDWQGNGNSQLGVFRNGEWWMRSATGQLLAYFSFGGQNAVPVSGDWDGNGVDGIGIYRNDDKFALTSTPDSPWAQRGFSYGASSDRPLFWR